MKHFFIIFCFITGVFMTDAQEFVIKAGGSAAGDLLGNWCRGTVKSIGAKGVEFVSKDGRKGVLSPKAVAMFSDKAVFKQGDMVWAIYEGESMLYQAIIKRVDGSKYLIAWVYDGEVSTETATLKADQMVKISDIGKWKIDDKIVVKQELKQEAKLEVGTEVAACFESGNWFKGRIEKSEDGEYLVVTNDGREAYLDKSKIKILSDNITVKVGEKIAALYGDEIFYGGTVQKLESGGVVVKWDDGTSPSFVANNKIITGVGGYDYVKQVYEKPEDLVGLSVNNRLFEVSRKTGRVYIDKSWVGDIDLKSYSLAAHSSFNASGKIEKDGNFYIMRGTSKSGYLNDKGEVYVAGRRIITISKPSSGAKVFWDDMRLMAITIAVYLE